MTRWAGIAALVVAAAYLLAVLALTVGQRWLIYRPPGDAEHYFPADFDRITLRTSDGLTLTAAYHPAAVGRPTLVFFHGNGDSFEGSNRATDLLREQGFGVLLAEYRGYAGNPGAPTEDGLYRDGRAALDWLAARGIAGRDVILIGYSLGSGIASQLATERGVGGLVLIAPFTGLVDAASHHFPYIPVRLLLRDRYANLDKLRGRHLPLFVLHGDRDRVIPWQQGRKVAEAVPGAGLHILRDIGHEIAFLPDTQIRIARWVDSLDPAKRAESHDAKAPNAPMLTLPPRPRY
ncbi:MAG: alpha/beta fold hydrolase [Candidatus Sphingomonas colombiensis]|nr:alpha/beta fold hydrolase [Sphingomonas sp.]WEK41771.1 MAG: alpha/beta fold hydrolase [Sphingomonas sp.]